MPNKQPWYHEVTIEFEIHDPFGEGEVTQLIEDLIQIGRSLRGVLRDTVEVVGGQDEHNLYFYSFQLLFTTTTGIVSETSLRKKLDRVFNKYIVIDLMSVGALVSEPEPGDPADLM